MEWRVVACFNVLPFDWTFECLNFEHLCTPTLCLQFRVCTYCKVTKCPWITITIFFDHLVHFLHFLLTSSESVTQSMITQSICFNDEFTFISGRRSATSSWRTWRATSWSRASSTSRWAPGRTATSPRPRRRSGRRWSARDPRVSGDKHISSL